VSYRQKPRKEDFYQMVVYKYILENFLKEAQAQPLKTKECPAGTRTPPPQLDNYDIYQKVQGLDTKTLVIHGDYDPIPVESSRKYSEMLPNSSFQLLNDCGHFPFIEKKEETLRCIVGFLNS